MDAAGSRAPLIDDRTKRRSEDETNRHLSKREVFRQSIYTARISVPYIVYCLLFALLSLALIIFLIGTHNLGKPIEVWVIVLDGILAFVLVMETAIDIYIEGKRFWRSPWHLFDFFCFDYFCSLLRSPYS